MSHYYVLLDPLKIQAYVFATNKLSIIIGASLELARWQDNCRFWSRAKSGHCLSAGGGNVLAVFGEKGQAEDFKDRAIEGAPPALEVAWAIEAEQKDDLKTWQQLQLAISRYKAGDRDPGDYPSLSPPRQTTCNYCGLRQATGKLTPEGRRICFPCRKLFDSGQRLHRNHSGTTPIEKLYQLVEPDCPGCFPQELEELTARQDKNQALRAGRSEADFLAVVVIDLNDLGRKVEQQVINKGFEALEKFSADLIETINQVCGTLVVKVASCKEGWAEYASGPDAGKKFVRFRPLLVGGDDIVVALPAPLWPEFVEQALEQLKNAGFSACAGVVVAKHNFPVNRLAEMAEELVAQAKKLVRFKESPSGDFSGCALDWAVHQESSFSSPMAVRRRNFLKEVSSNHYELATQRPYSLEDFRQLRRRLANLTASNRKLFSLYKSLRQGTQATLDTLKYTFFRDESEKLSKYPYIWKLLEDIPGDWPLWEKMSFSRGRYTANLYHTWVADLLELKFILDQD